MARARGFTLIELVVIILLGILATVAAPKFIDTSKQARLAAVNTMAGVKKARSSHQQVLAAL